MQRRVVLVAQAVAEGEIRTKLPLILCVADVVGLLDMCIAAEAGEGAGVAEVSEELDLRRRVGLEGADGVIGVGGSADLVVVKPERPNLRAELQAVVPDEIGEVIDVGVALAGVGGAYAVEGTGERDERSDVSETGNGDAGLADVGVGAGSRNAKHAHLDAVVAELTLVEYPGRPNLVKGDDCVLGDRYLAELAKGSVLDLCGVALIDVIAGIHAETIVDVVVEAEVSEVFLDFVVADGGYCP